MSWCRSFMVFFFLTPPNAPPVELIKPPVVSWVDMITNPSFSSPPHHNPSQPGFTLLFLSRSFDFPTPQPADCPSTSSPSSVIPRAPGSPRSREPISSPRATNNETIAPGSTSSRCSDVFPFRFFFRLFPSAVNFFVVSAGLPSFGRRHIPSWRFNICSLVRLMCQHVLPSSSPPSPPPPCVWCKCWRLAAPLSSLYKKHFFPSSCNLC